MLVNLRNEHNVAWVDWQGPSLTPLKQNARTAQGLHWWIQN